MNEPGKLKIQFLDVGQGDGTFIEFPGDADTGKTMLVDLGSTKNKRVTGPDAKLYFQTHTKFAAKGQTLDYLVLSHGDRDHYNLVKSFIDELEVNVGVVLYGGLAADYGALIGNLGADTVLVATDSLPIFLCDAAETGNAEAAVLAVNADLGRKPNDKAWRKNTSSVVLKLTYSGRSVLLMADGTEDTELAMVSYYLGRGSTELLTSDVLKVGHHGSHRSSNRAWWLKQVNPRFAFISADRSGSLGEEQATGHRLPQHLTIDLLKAHSSRLETNCAPHGYVSAFQKSDYDSFNEAPDNPPGQPMALPAEPTVDSWFGHHDTFGVFTTLVQLDVSEAEESVHDQGVQHELIITSSGGIFIGSTFGPSGQVLYPAPVDEDE